MKTNDIIEVTTERMSFGGAAVARFMPSQTSSENPKPIVIFVEGAAPNERVQAILTQKHRNYWQASVTKILDPSPDRVAPRCSVFGQCGGCHWQHLSYEAQVREKTIYLTHCLRKTIKENLEQRLVIHPAPHPYSYRTRLQVRGDQKGLGFFAPQTHKIVYAETCEIAHPKIQKRWVNLATDSKRREQLQNPKSFKVEWSLDQNGNLLESLNDKHAALGFSQVNQLQNETLKKIVHTWATTTETSDLLLDLYGGNGNLSKDLVGKFKTIVCVDENNEGMEVKNFNIKNAGLGFFLVKSDVQRFLRVQKTSLQIDRIIADPPRSGLGKTAHLLADVQPKHLLLVSCDPNTLARDLGILNKRYEIQRLHFIDMFPQTYHIEALAELKIRA